MGDAADPRDGKRTFIVPAIKPFDHYDFSRAKIACNLAWLVAKAFGTGRRWPSVPPSPAAASIPVLFPSSGSPPPRSPPGSAHRLGDAMGFGRRRKEGGNRLALQSRASGLRRWDAPDFFYWRAEVGVCCFCFFFLAPVTSFVTFLHGVVLICGIFLIVLHSFPPQS